MPPKSKVTGLPAEVKLWLDKALVEGNFAGYEALSEELKAKGYDISKTGLHRYGQKFEERLQSLRISTEQAKVLVDLYPDEDDAVNQALLRVTQEKLFNLMMELEIDPKKVDISKITRSIADLARSSTGAKDYAAKVRARVKEVAQEVNAMAKSAGLTDAAAKDICDKILGVAQ